MSEGRDGRKEVKKYGNPTQKTTKDASRKKKTCQGNSAEDCQKSTDRGKRFIAQNMQISHKISFNVCRAGR